MVERDLSSGGEHQLREFAVRARGADRLGEIDREAFTAMQALAEARVEVLLLKGAALATTLYGSREARAYGDTDLLVRPSAIGRAGDVLAGLGYRNVDEVRGIGDIGRSVHAQTWSRLDPERGNTTIDLHRRLAGCDAPDEVVFDVLFGRRAPVAFASGTVDALDRQAAALHLALHVAQHGPIALKAVADLDRGLERWPPETWREAAVLASELGARESFAAGLALSSSHADMLDELALGFPRGRLWAIQNRLSRPRGTFHLQALRDAGGVSPRFNLIRRALLPPSAWMRWEYRWADRGRAQLAMAYLLHIVRSPAWALRAWTYARRARAAGRG